ncbi:hypothetical protein KXD40_003301 [Peronospora effusa]|uniref:FYVE zinc finger domain-containing protein n=1 Tax=Peronospora effusa TaxID=542832 RepID=A0A3M6VAQ3_9STRA|nr:hypothetical protein DD238_007470 [Peronospora effusa]RQM13329.1 hypothetical protein DD237_003844 [Peronospora effusa]UIZ29779.1 hypothetical protein KXD40_003301 [Peronospora effusa]
MSMLTSDGSSMIHLQSEWTDKTNNTIFKHFGAVNLLETRRYNCMVCGDAICRACRHNEEVKVPWC